MNENRESLIIRQRALIDNPSTRLPICLVLDASSSMATGKAMGDAVKTGKKKFEDGQEVNLVEGGYIRSRMDELNEGVEMLVRDLLSDPRARRSAELCIVAFAAGANIVRDFEPMSETHLGSRLQVTDQAQTSLGSGVKIALELLERRKNDYRRAGVDYYQPWLVVITDGVATDLSHLDLVDPIRNLVDARKLAVFPIAVGNVDDLSHLALISPGQSPLKLSTTNFPALFKWLSSSASRVAGTVVGEVQDLDFDDFKGMDNL